MMCNAEDFCVNEQTNRQSGRSVGEKDWIALGLLFPSLVGLTINKLEEDESSQFLSFTIMNIDKSYITVVGCVGHLDNLEENIFSRLVDAARAATSRTVSIKCWNLEAIQRPFQGNHYLEVGRFSSY